MLIVQGDVFVVPANVPKTAKQINVRPLAYGEVTGHSHAVIDPVGVMMYDDGGTLYLSASKEVTVKHEEHTPVTIPAGEWRVGIVKEYDAFDEEARDVRD